MSSGVLRYFHPVLPSARLRRQPVQVRIADRACVLFRDANGHAAALDDRCPHRRASLSNGQVLADGRIACPYHGWNFDAQGHGRSPASPALRNCDTRSYQVVERLGFVWMAEHSATAFPRLEWDGFDYAGPVETYVRGPMDVTLDNISEDEHFAFIHSTFGWDPAHAADVKVETATFPDRSEVRYTGPQRASLWAPLGGVHRGDRFYNEWTTRFDPVHSVYTFGWHDPRTDAPRPITTRAVVFLVPETAETTWIRMFIFMRIAPSLRRRFRPLMFRMARHIAAKELRRDAQLIEDVAGAPRELAGMRLTAFDKALIHNRKLLDALYWRGSAPPVLREAEAIA